MRWFVPAVMLAGCGRVSFRTAVDGNTTVDASGGSPDARVGPSGFALRTNGLSGYATFDSLCSELTGAFTVNAWVRPDSTQPEAYSALFAANSDTGNSNLSVEAWDTQSGVSRVDYFDDGAVMGAEMNFTGAGDHWNFLSLVIDAAGTGAVYQNGVSSSEFTTTRTIVPPCKVSLGQEWDGNNASNFFAGYFDEVTIWNVAKSPAQLLDDMNRTPLPTEPDLVGYFTFDDTTANDSTAHGHDGTLRGSATIEQPPPS